MAQAILVVGAAGQVGRALMRHPRDDSRPLIALTSRELDIRDASETHAAIERLAPGVVINAAAYTAVDKAEQEPDLAFSVNRDGTGNLAAACEAFAVPLLHISTDYVFDGGKSGAYQETDAVAPLGVYGASKLAGEELLRERLEQHVILRTAWIFSAHRTNFVKTIVRLASERSELRVVSDQRGCPTPADSIASALLAITARLRQGGAGWGTYHFCGAPATNWWEFARAIVDVAAAHLGKRIPVVPISTADYPTAARRPMNSAMDCGKIAAAFGLTRPDWRQSVPRVVAEIFEEGATE
jgi:dTDP-4-dehydrorhamnose reductase